MLVTIVLTACLSLNACAVYPYGKALTAYFRFQHWVKISNEQEISYRRDLDPVTEKANANFDSRATESESVLGNESQVIVDWRFPVKGYEDNNVCGESKPNQLNRIFGGETAPPGKWPWMAALGYVTADGRQVSYRCGGTIITARHVLTAAHCVASPSGPPKFVLIGVSDLQDDKSGRIELIVDSKVHERYNEHGNDNDIAILLLENHLNFTSKMLPACLPLVDYSLRDHNFTGARVIVAGWGTRSFSEHETSSRMLQWAEIRVLNSTICQEAYLKAFKRQIDSRTICAAHPQWAKDACQGDSGGPIVWLHDGSYYIIGIVSYGNGCAFEGFPGVYARVDHYMEWLQDAIDTLY